MGSQSVNRSVKDLVEIKRKKAKCLKSLKLKPWGPEGSCFPHDTLSGNISYFVRKYIILCYLLGNISYLVISHEIYHTLLGNISLLYPSFLENIL